MAVPRQVNLLLFASIFLAAIIQISYSVKIPGISGNYVIGGKFVNITGKGVEYEQYSFNHVAWFNGTHFTQMGDTSNNNYGVKYQGSADNAEVYKVKKDPFQNVYIVGKFDEAGGVKTGPVAVWKKGKDNWEPLGSADDWAKASIVYDISVDCYNLQLSIDLPCKVYVGGSFKLTDKDGKDAINVAQFNYDGEKWSKFDSGSLIKENDRRSYVISIYHEETPNQTGSSSNKVYIGFANARGDNDDVYLQVYRQDEDEWVTPKQQPNNPITSFSNQDMLTDTDRLYVAGNFVFTPSGSTTQCNYVCRFNHKSVEDDNEQEWFPVGDSKQLSTSNGIVNKVIYEDDNVYVAGKLDTTNIQRIEYSANSFESFGGTSQNIKEEVKSFYICGYSDSLFGCPKDTVTIVGNNFAKKFDPEKKSWVEFETNNFDEMNINSVTFNASSIITPSIVLSVLSLLLILFML